MTIVNMGNDVGTTNTSEFQRQIVPNTAQHWLAVVIDKCDTRHGALVRHDATLRKLRMRTRQYLRHAHVIELDGCELIVTLMISRNHWRIQGLPGWQRHCVSRKRKRPHPRRSGRASKVDLNWTRDLGAGLLGEHGKTSGCYCCATKEPTPGNDGRIIIFAQHTKHRERGKKIDGQISKPLP